MTEEESLPFAPGDVLVPKDPSAKFTFVVFRKTDGTLWFHDANPDARVWEWPVAHWSMVALRHKYPFLKQVKLAIHAADKKLLLDPGE